MDVVAHFKREEIQAMERIQGGADLEKYGAPYFGKLWKIIQTNPEIKEQTSNAVRELMDLPLEEAESLAEEMDHLLDQKFGPKSEVPVPKPQNPVEQEIASLGEEGDTKVAFMPAEMLEFLWDLYPDEVPVEDRINENTGLPEFWFFKIVLPFLLGTVGNIIAPGIGGAIGGAIGSLGGNLINNAMSPEHEQKSFLGMLGDAMLAGGLGYAGGAGVEAFKGGKGLMDSAGAAFDALGKPLVAGVTGVGGLLSSMGKSNKGSPSTGNDLSDYNKFMLGARQRDLERVNKYNIEATQHRESENKRLAEYEKQLEAHRQQELANEDDYFKRRNETLARYNSSYHPKFSPAFLQTLMTANREN